MRARRAGLTGVLVLTALSGIVGTGHAASSLRPCRPGHLCQNFTVQVSYKQHRVWTHHTADSGDGDCLRSSTGNGSDDAELLEVGKPGFSTLKGTPGPFAVASLAMDGAVTKRGTASESLSGPRCTPAAVFPSTWRIVTEIGGGSTATEPATGCGTKQIVPKFPSLEFHGSTLRLQWNSSPEPPVFDPCPDFEGANDLIPGAKSIPTSTFADVDVPVDLAALVGSKRHRVTARGSVTASAIENCQVLQGGVCPPNTTYEATATVVTRAYVTFIRGRPTRYPRR